MNPRTASLLLLALCPPAFASTYTWTGTASAAWSDPANWGGSGPPVSGDTATFGTVNTNATAVDVGTGIAVNTIRWSGTTVAEGITAGTGGITLDAGGQIRYGAVASGTANVTINRPITFGGAAAIINDNNGGGGNNKQLKFDPNATFTGGGNTTNLSGRILGDSTNSMLVDSVRFGFTLSGSGSNTLAGTTTFNSRGDVNLSKTGGAVAVAGNLTANANAGGNTSLVVKWNGNDQVANTSLATLTAVSGSTAILRLNGKTDTIGGLTNTGVSTSIVENESGAANTGTLTAITAACRETPMAKPPLKRVSQSVIMPTPPIRSGSNGIVRRLAASPSPQRARPTPGQRNGMRWFASIRVPHSTRSRCSRPGTAMPRPSIAPPATDRSI